MLKSINIIEYSKIPMTTNRYSIIITYCNGKPVLNNIVSTNLKREGSITSSNWQKEINSKRALYIAYTTSGIKLVDSFNTRLTPLRLLFRVELN